MPAINGNVFLLKEGDGAGVGEAFVTVAGLRGTSFSINGSPIVVTDKDAAGFRKLLDTGGEKTLTISADGTYLPGDTQQDNLEARATDGSLNNYQITDGTKTIEGSFQVVSYEADGPLNEAVTFSVTLESADEWTVA